VKKIKLSIAAARYIWPVGYDPMLHATANMAQKIMSRMIKN